MQSDGGVLVSDLAVQAAPLSQLYIGSSLGMFLTVQLPVIAGPSVVLLPLGPLRSDGCFSSLIPTVELIQ